MSSFHLPNPSFEPLLRYLHFQPQLVRFAAQSNAKTLQTVLLRDSALAAGSTMQFDDSCQLTVVEGSLDKLTNVKLVVAGPPRKVKGLHLVVLSTAGQINLTVGGDQVRMVVCANVVMRATVNLAGEASLFVGDGTTMANMRILAANADVSIGDDCQVGEDVVIQASDQHPITDLDSGEVVNFHRRSVKLGRHVWLGRRVLVLPDTQLGDGCIVDAGAVVDRNVAAQTQVGGAPVQVIRQRAGWSRNFGKTPPTF